MPEPTESPTFRWERMSSRLPPDVDLRVHASGSVRGDDRPSRSPLRASFGARERLVSELRNLQIDHLGLPGGDAAAADGKCGMDEVSTLTSCDRESQGPRTSGRSDAVNVYDDLRPTIDDGCALRDRDARRRHNDEDGSLTSTSLPRQQESLSTTRTGTAASRYPRR